MRNIGSACFAVVLAATLFSTAPQLRAGGSGDTIFVDGFETPVAPACVAGPESGPTLGGAPAGTAATLLCFELREDLATTRSGEAAFGSVPVPRAANLLDGELDRLVVIGPGARHLPAQFRVLGRWGAPLSTTSAPILWLGVALRPDLPASATTVFALRRYASAPGVADPDALTVTPDGAGFLVDTGLAQFRFDPTHATLLDRIGVRAIAGGALTNVYQYQAAVAGYGFEATIAQPNGAPLISASNALAGSLAVDSFELVESGPVRAVFHLRGHLESADDADRCTIPDPNVFGNRIVDPTFLAFPFSVTIAATRGSRHLEIDWQFVSACSDANGIPWDDQLVRIDSLAWHLRLNAGAAGARSPATGGSGVVVLHGNGNADRYSAHQHRGAGVPWLRRAEVRNETTSALLDSAQAFENPLAGLAGPNVVAAIHAPWLRYREPQALEVEGERLAFRLVSEPSRVGEGKGLWFSGRLSLDPPSNDPATVLAARRLEARAALERGLLPHARVADFNGSGVLPSLGSGAPSALLTAYQMYFDMLHDALIRDVPCTDAATFQGGQWTCAKTFGSQLWPDTQNNVQFNFVDNATPNENGPLHDYWGSHNAELVEFQRSGDPKWVWDFALPLAWLQAHTAYVNVGPRDITTYNGFAPNSGGGGDGTWHRSNDGSSDYSYNMGFGLAYAARPMPALRDRFARMGVSAMNLFTTMAGPPETQFVIARFNIQRLRGLLYCAQFVPGATGAACDQELRAGLDHLAANSISAGILCEDMEVANSACAFGQTFMGVALFYPFLDEVHRLYGPTLSVATRDALRRALIQTPRVYRQFAIPSLAGGRPDVDGAWSSVLDCVLSGAGFSTVTSCMHSPQPEPFLFGENKPAATHWWFRSHALDPSNGLCAEGRGMVDDMFDGPDPLGPLRTYVQGGWAKAPSQDAQSLAYALGGYETCVP